MKLVNFLNFRRVSAKDKALFTRALAAAIEAGIPILKAITIVSGEVSNKYLRKIGESISSGIERGEKLSTALKKFPDVFDEVYVYSIAAAEVSGRMEEILKELADQQENEYKMQSAIKGAVAYPLLVFFTMVVVTLFLMAIVVPRVQSIMTEVNLDIPASTQVLLSSSIFISKYWYIVTLGIIGLILWLRIFSKTEIGRMFFSRLVINFPIIGSMYTNVYMSRFTKTFLTLSTAGVPLLKSIDLVGKVIDNMVLEKVLQKARDDVERGIPMSASLSKSHVFPVLVTQMITVGEQTGKLDEVFTSLAELYDGESERNISMITSLLEPILLLIVGLGIGIIVFAIIIPIYQATNLI